MFNHSTVRQVAEEGLWRTADANCRPGRLTRWGAWLIVRVLDGYDPALQATWREHGGLENGTLRRRREAAERALAESTAGKIAHARRIRIGLARTERAANAR